MTDSQQRGRGIQCTRHTTCHQHHSVFKVITQFRVGTEDLYPVLNRTDVGQLFASNVHLTSRHHVTNNRGVNFIERFTIELSSVFHGTRLNGVDDVLCAVAVHCVTVSNGRTEDGVDQLSVREATQFTGVSSGRQTIQLSRQRLVDLLLGVRTDLVCGYAVWVGLVTNVELERFTNQDLDLFGRGQRRHVPVITTGTFSIFSRSNREVFNTPQPYLRLGSGVWVVGVVHVSVDGTGEVSINRLLHRQRRHVAIGSGTGTGFNSRSDWVVLYASQADLSLRGLVGVTHVQFVRSKLWHHVRVDQRPRRHWCHVAVIRCTCLSFQEVSQREVFNEVQTYLGFCHRVRVVLVVDVLREVRTGRLSDCDCHLFQNRKDGFNTFEVFQVPLVVNRGELVWNINHFFPRSDPGVGLRVGQTRKVRRCIQHPVATNGLVADLEDTREGFVEHGDRTVHPSRHAV